MFKWENLCLEYAVFTYSEGVTDFLYTYITGSPDDG